MKQEASIPEVFSKVIHVRSQSGLDTSPALLLSLKNAAVHNQIEVFYSPFKTPVGYVAWASVNKEAMLMMSKTKLMPPFSYEWSEGRFMVIFDLAILPRWGRVSRGALISFLSKRRFVSYLKRGRLHVWRKKESHMKRHVC